jgi:hypothetical protein
MMYVDVDFDVLSEDFVVNDYTVMNGVRRENNPAVLALVGHMFDVPSELEYINELIRTALAETLEGGNWSDEIADAMRVSEDV